MKDSRARRLLAEAIELLDRCEPVLGDRLQDITGAMNGYPAGGEGGGGQSPSDRTGNAAIRPDRARTDRNRLESILESIASQSSELVYLLARYTPRPASDKERAQTLADNERSDSCASCRRLEVAKGVARWEPVFRGDLCRWCYDWRRETGDVPSVPTLQAHHRGVRVRVAK